jgi:fumarylacetoacetate (FAA) hydrolase
MQLGSLPGPGRDGTLVVLSEDRARAARRPAGLATLQQALDDWTAAEPRLRAAAAALDDGSDRGEPIDLATLHSPLPRAYQWCEASTYLTHMERIRAARGMELPPEHRREPIVYQSGADACLAPREPIELVDESYGLDLEATVAVVVDDVPRRTSAADAARHIKLVLLTNDLTYRNLMPAEYAKGVGPYRAKPERAYAPLAVTPDALGEAWSGTLLRARVRSWVNGELLGEPDAGCDCAFDFAELIAYMTATRRLAAGTIIGSGTVSNRDDAAGYGCLAERRAVETVRSGAPVTPLLRAGDTVRIEAFDRHERSVFGALEQTVVGPQPTPGSHPPTGSGGQR